MCITPCTAAARSTHLRSQASAQRSSQSAIDFCSAAWPRVSEPRAVATGSGHNLRERLPHTCSKQSTSNPAMTDQIDTILDSELEQLGATAPIATVSDFLTLSREPHLAQNQPTRLHSSTPLRSKDISCFRETPMDSGRSSKVLPLSEHELHSLSSRSESPLASCRLRPPREHGSCERLLSISASFGLRTFRESLIQQPADRANQGFTGGCFSRSRSCLRLKSEEGRPGVPYAR